MGRPTTHEHPALRTAGRQTPLAVEKGTRGGPARRASDNTSSGRPLLCGTAWSEPGYRQLEHPTGLVRHRHADRRGAPTLIRGQGMRRQPAWPVDGAMDDRGTASLIGCHLRRRPSHSKTFAARMKDQSGIVQHRRCGRKHWPRSCEGGDVKVVHLQLGLNLDALSSQTPQLRAAGVSRSSDKCNPDHLPHAEAGTKGPVGQAQTAECPFTHPGPCAAARTSWRRRPLRDFGPQIRRGVVSDASRRVKATPSITGDGRGSVLESLVPNQAGLGFVRSRPSWSSWTLQATGCGSFTGNARRATGESEDGEVEVGKVGPDNLRCDSDIA
jgi:hypothetical protein